MINLSKALSFIKKLNESVQTFLATNSKTISDTKKECELADEQAKAFIDEINQKVRNYKDKNFGSIINSVNKLINSLAEEYPNECKSAKTYVAKYNFDKIEDGINILKEEVGVFNGLVDQLDSVDFDEKCPPKSIKVDGEVVTVSSSDGAETFNTRHDKDDFFIPQLLDSELVENTIVRGLNVIAIIEIISSIFERELDIPSLIKNNENLLNNYKFELNSNCETFVNESFSKSIDSGESRDYYSKFFEELDSMDLASTPNIETGSEKFKEGIRMGRLKLNICDTSNPNGKEILKYLKGVDILKERISSNHLDFPLVADLRDKGNVLLRINEENYSNTTKDFVNQLIIAFSLSFPCSRVYFKLVDIGNKMGFSSLIAFQKVSNNIFLDGIVRDERELDDAIKSVKNLKLAAEDKLNLDAMSNVFDYNKKMDAAPMNVYLFVLVDFPSKIVSSHANDILNIVCNGKDFGIFSVIVDNGAIELEYNFEKSDYQKVVSSIAKTAYVFDLHGDEINYIEKDKHYKLELLSEVGKNNLTKIIEVLSNNAHTETSKPIPLTKMFEYMDNTKVGSISSEFEIPFGMAGADVQTLRLGKEPHSAVIGGTGSGKSIFFHTLILDACYRYSPEELNFYLLDFKGGMEFSYYKDNKLPHVKLIGLTKDMNDGLSILANLRNEMQNRMTIFTEEGADNIDSYYKRGNKKRIARLFVIIDEIQEIFRDESVCEKALNILSEILALGRACGINVFWGSQSVPSVSGIDNKLMQNIANRICLKVENTDYAMRLFSDGINLKPVIDIKNRPEKGYGVISDSRTGNAIKEFRVAYSEDRDNRSKYYSVVHNKWAGVGTEDDLYVLGDDFVPDVKKNEFYSFDPLKNIISSKLSESYELGIGTSYVSGKPYMLDLKLLEARSNVAFIGTDVGLLRDLIGFSLLSIVLNRCTDADCLNNPENKILYVNKEGTIDPKLALDLYNVLPRENQNIISNVSSTEKFKNAIKDLFAVYTSRVETAENGEYLDDTSSYFVFIHYFQYFNEMIEKNEPLEESGFSMFGEENNSIRIADVLKALMTKGGDFGIHFVLTINSTGFDNFYSIKKELQDFKYKIAIRGCDLRNISSVSPSQVPNINNDRICVCCTGNDLTKIRPYRYDETNKADEQWYRNSLKEFLDASKKGA